MSPRGLSLLARGLIGASALALLRTASQSFVGTSGQRRAAEARDHSPTALRGLKFGVGGLKAPTRSRVVEEKEEEEEEKPGWYVEDDLPPSPKLYQWPRVYQRLALAPDKPGHLVQRRWAKKAKEQGYASVPFGSAVRKALQDEGVNICLVGRRESSDAVAKAWQKVIDTVPMFDISGEVDAPDDLDPLEPNWEQSLLEGIPSDEEVRLQLQDPRVVEKVAMRAKTREEDIVKLSRGEAKGAQAAVFRKVVAEMPKTLLEEEFTSLIRSSIVEIGKLLLVAHHASGGKRLRWRFVCTDEDSDSPSWPEALRAYFILAGEELDFVPSQYIDGNRLQAFKRLSEEQTRRMSSEDWVSAVTKKDTDVDEALKRVPAGWTTFLKGDAYPGSSGRGAVFRLPRTGRRVKIEVEWLDAEGGEAAAPAVDEAAAPAEATEEQSQGGWLGPLAGLTAGLIALAKSSAPFQAGRKRRTEVNDVLKTLNKPQDKQYFGPNAEVLKSFEKQLWMDTGKADEAPVVMVVGGQSETGRLVCRKLVTSGYHVVLLKFGEDGQPRAQRMLPQGAVLSTVTANRRYAPIVPDIGDQNTLIPMDLYEAVAGVDKVVACFSDEVGESQRMMAQELKNILSCWQCYRYDFAESQRAYSSKVTLFRLLRDTDFELWNVEQQFPSDMRYGLQFAMWKKNLLPRYSAPEEGAEQGRKIYKEAQTWFHSGFYEPLGQVVLNSPKLRLNFTKFSGILIRVHNKDFDNKYSFFLRTEDFEESRVQYEVDFECKANTSHAVRMPFHAFKPVRVDGVSLPEHEAAARPLDRSQVVQIGIVVRTGEDAKPLGEGESVYSRHKISLETVHAFRVQAEPQVVYIGRDSESGIGLAHEATEVDDDEDTFDFSDVDFTEEELRKEKAEEAAGRELEAFDGLDPSNDNEEDLDFFDEDMRPLTPMQAVLESGLAYTIVKVKGFNEHPGGKYPVHVEQDSIHTMPLAASHDELRPVSRGDAAELAVAALTEPTCVNTELFIGEARREGAEAAAPAHARAPAAASFEISSTVKEDVSKHLKQLMPNR